MGNNACLLAAYINTKCNFYSKINTVLTKQTKNKKT